MTREQLRDLNIDPALRAIWLHKTIGQVIAIGDATADGTITDIVITPKRLIVELDGNEIWGPIVYVREIA